jgi:hypothetical protein
VAIVAAQQPRDRLTEGLAQQVPERDVEPADGVLDGASAPLPERTLAQFFADPFGLEDGLALQKRRQQRQRGLDKRLAGKTTANAGQALVGLDFEQGVHLLVGIGAAGPARIVRGAAKWNRPNTADRHGGAQWLVISGQ